MQHLKDPCVNIFQISLVTIFDFCAMQRFESVAVKKNSIDQGL